MVFIAQRKVISDIGVVSYRYKIFFVQILFYVFEYSDNNDLLYLIMK